MQVLLTSTSVELSSRARKLISRMVEDSLSRFSHRVAQASVFVIDENGPRGGVDKLCRINLQLSGHRQVITEGRHTTIVGAVAEAARRAQRIIKTKKKRKKSGRKPIRFDGDLPDEPINAIQVLGG